MSDPIVITGMGLVTPLGVGVDAVWRNLMAGQSGIGPINRPGYEEITTKIAGLVPMAEDHSDGLDIGAVIPVKDRKKMDLFTIYALAATEQALEQAGWHPEAQDQKNRTATVIGTGIGGFPTVTAAVRTLDNRGPRRLSPFVIPAFLGNLAAGHVSMRHGFRGPIGAPITACAAGLQGIGDAVRLINSGEADVAIAGGTEACVDPLALAGFNAARALATDNDTPENASRPYDGSRAGFVLSEGAGMVVIERLSHAVARGAEPLAVIAGYGTSADAYHMTAGPEDGSGAALAVAAALAQSGVSVGDIGYINGHATSTPVGDAGEIAALRSQFGDDLPATPISSTKSATGHMLGAAGAVEAIFTVMALRTGQLPATLNFVSPDEGNEDLDFIPDLDRRADIDHALCNAFGFGGVNASVVLSKV